MRYYIYRSVKILERNFPRLIDDANLCGYNRYVPIRRREEYVKTV